MTPEEYARFIELYNWFLANTGMRKGQALFNAAVSVIPELVEELVGTEVDPFYDDSRISAFLTAIGEPPF